MYEGRIWRPLHFTLNTMTYHCVPTLNMYVWHTNTCTLLSRRVCNFSQNTIFLNRLHVRNCVRIIEVSDNRGTDNRGRTVNGLLWKGGMARTKMNDNNEVNMFFTLEQQPHCHTYLFMSISPWLLRTAWIELCLSMAAPHHLDRTVLR